MPLLGCMLYCVKRFPWGFTTRHYTRKIVAQAGNITENVGLCVLSTAQAVLGNMETAILMTQLNGKSNKHLN